MYGDYMNCVGYHGTTAEKAESIFKTSFRLSKKSTEWLGFGVYFFANVQWAIEWVRCKENPKVIQAKLFCKDTEYFDLDDLKNMKHIENEMQSVFIKKRSYTAKFNSAEKRCFSCNYFGEKYNIKIFSYTFCGFSYNSVGFPENHKQKQYCVRNLTCINDKKIYPVDTKGMSLDAI